MGTSVICVVVEGNPGGCGRWEDGESSRLRALQVTVKALVAPFSLEFVQSEPSPHGWEGSQQRSP